LYTNAAGQREPASIVQVHREDVEVYYTILLGSTNRERQTTLAKLAADPGAGASDDSPFEELALFNTSHLAADGCKSFVDELQSLLSQNLGDEMSKGSGGACLVGAECVDGESGASDCSADCDCTSLTSATATTTPAATTAASVPRWHRVHRRRIRHKRRLRLHQLGDNQRRRRQQQQACLFGTEFTDVGSGTSGCSSNCDVGSGTSSGSRNCDCTSSSFSVAERCRSACQMGGGGSTKRKQRKEALIKGCIDHDVTKAKAVSRGSTKPLDSIGSSSGHG
jgi:hypothetical protein